MIAFNSVNRFYSYLNHFIKARSKFSIHSPFVFEFVTKVIKDKNILPEYIEIELLRDQILKNHQFINISDFGTGALRNRQRRISGIANTSLKSKKQAQLINRLTHYFNPNMILELGTSLGLTTIYIAMAVPQSRIITLEGCDKIASMAKKYFNFFNVNNVELNTGNIDHILPQILSRIDQLDMVFFDANHTYEATIRYFIKCAEKAHNNSIFIFDDIHWSSGMERAWNQIKASNEVTLTMDLYHMGIVFFKKELSKEDFSLRI